LADVRATRQVMDLRYEPDDPQCGRPLLLREYFDSSSTHLKKLGLAFVAKQLPEVKASTGSRTQGRQRQAGAGDKKPTAKAYFLASEALERDLELSRQRSIATLSTFTKTDLYRVEDVQQRQIEYLFREVQDFLRFVPPKVHLRSLLPADIDKEEERKEAQAADKANASLFDKRLPSNPKVFEWFLRPAEAVMMVQVATCWIHAAYAGSASSPLGIDRPTFCRFLLDVGLVDQSKVTLFWATSLFDEVSRPMRSCAVLESRAALVPILPTVNLWLLASILEIILKQLLPSDGKTKFLLSLWKIARLRLPHFAVDESDLKEDLFRKLSTGQLDMQAVTDAHFKSAPPAETRREPNTGVAGKRKEPPAGAAQFDSGDLCREESAREFRVHSMLVEPEVLHLVMSRQSLWRTLFAAYADGEEHMSFQALQQFCRDFLLMPEITSWHYLRSCYKTAQAADIRIGCPAGSKASTMSTPDGEGSQEPGRRRPGALPVGRRKPGPGPPPQARQRSASLRSTSSLLGDGSPVMRRRPSGRPIKRFESPQPQLLPDIRKRDVEDKDVDDAKILLDPVPGEIMMTKQNSGIRNRLEPHMPMAWKLIADAAERPGRGRSSSRLVAFSFGLPAFVETLFRISFRYMGSYGNMFQQSSGGYARAVWLLSYLRSVYDQLCLGKQSQQSGSLQKVLSTPAEELWETLPSSISGPLQPTKVRRKLLKEDKPGGKDGKTGLPSSQKSSDVVLPKRGKRRSVTMSATSKPSKQPPAMQNQQPSGAMSARTRRQSLHETSTERSPSLDAKPKVVQPPVVSKLLDSSDDEDTLLPATPQVSQRSARKSVIPSQQSDTMHASHLEVPATSRSAKAPVEAPPPTMVAKQWVGEPTLPPVSCPGPSPPQELEIGQCYVVQNYCRLCGTRVSEDEWGSPGCMGCAVTDSLPLEKHIFRSFLVSTSPYSLNTPLDGPLVGANLNPNVEGMPVLKHY